jgi:hypothetical protein
MNRRAAVWVAAAAATLAFGFLLGFAANRPVGEAAEWFTGAAVGLAAFALGAAVLTALFAYPDYRAFLERQHERPNMELSLQVRPARNPTEFESINFDERVQVPWRQFELRVVLHNAGNAVFRWAILNIQVPVPCKIEATDLDPKVHYTSMSPGDSHELADGTTMPCNFTVAERDFPPGHHFLYHAEVTLDASKKEWPVVAVLDGYPAKRAWSRAVILYA